MEEKEKKSKKEKELVGCGLPGSDFHILPIATPKSLIVWPQTKYCRDHSTPASRRLAAEKPCCLNWSATQSACDWGFGASEREKRIEK